MEALAASGIYGLVTWLFFPVLRDTSRSFYQELLVNALSPDREGVGYYLRNGQLPAWVRDTYAGGPYAAQIQHALYYPGNLPFTFLDSPAQALDVVIALSVVWAAIGGWAYCRFALKTSFVAALFAGLTFGFGGMSLQHIILTNQLQALSWMPFVLLFAHLALETKRWRYVVLTSLSIGFGLLAGHPEEWVYTCGALGLYTIAWVLAGVRLPARELGRRALDGAARIGAAFAVFVGLFGFQLLPTLSLMGQGYRSSSDFREQYPMPKGIAVNSLLPDYGRILYGENVAFIGVIALGLAALGLVASHRSPLWLRLWMVGISAFGLAMAVGNANPLYTFLYENVSMIRSFRVPSRYLLLPSFALAMAAALGLDALLHDHRGRLRERARQGALALATLGGIFAIAFLIGDLKTEGLGLSAPKWLLAGLIALLAWAVMSSTKVPALAVAVVLFFAAAVELHTARPFAEYHQSVRTVLYDDPGPVMRDLKAAGGRYITIAAGPSTPEDKRSLGTMGLSGTDYRYFLTAWPGRIAARPNAHHAVRAETVLGRDGGLLPLETYRDFFLNAAGKGNINGGQFPIPPSRWNWNGLDLLAVQSFVTPGLPPEESKVLEQHGFSIVKREAYVLVWRRTEPPLGRVYYDLDVMPTREERIAALPTYPLLQRAMVPDPVPDLGRPSTPAVVRNVSVEDERVELEVTSSAKGLLVLADPWFPGWQAKVDGKSQRIQLAQHAFRGVVVPAGTSTVVFTYRDKARESGFLLVPTTGLVLLLGYVLRRKRREEIQADV